ncbi:MAG TPA: NAD(P)/FAD-dependent oxidoreductase [Pseudolabrys sp.]|jgi:NADH dehydrogenase
MSETVLDRSRAPEVARPNASESAAATAALGARRKRIVIVGGGFAGIAAARALRKADADVVVIDRRNHHIFQPLLYQVATAVLAPSDIAAPIRQLAEKQRNVSVVLGEVTGVDLNARSLDALCPGVGNRKIEFDYLVIATGMQPSYFGHDEFAKYAPGLKTLSDAETIRAKILSAYELADTTDDETERARQMTFVLVGAGPTGVELAASMALLAAVTLRGEFRRIEPAKNSIILVEGGKRILPTFAERLASRAVRRLEKLGVKVMTGVRVETVDEDGVVANGQRIPSATVLWTAGVAPSPLLKLLGTQTDRAGRVSVGPYLNVQDVHRVYVVGDAASVVSDGRPVPGVAQAAIQQGRYVGRVIARQLDGRLPKRPFRYFDKGSMAVVGSNFAVLESGRLRMSGFLTWLVWVFLHVMSLPQLQNRMRVQSQWLWSYFSGQRSARLIPELPRGETREPDR